ncbi:MAG: DUF2854 domain-containing protein [Leptolyngbyaceae bacterium]|nr:DUF2854 domain-containing protein [Leptolyngbyaceae bacterium]
MLSKLSKISLGNAGLVVGGILTVVGFAAYFMDYATLNLAGFFYGIPVLLGGFALKAAELKPVPFYPPTSESVLKLRDEQATDTQHQIRKDVTRYRYGQDAHLEEALDYLGLSPTDEERPALGYLREDNIDGHYALTLGFYSPLIGLDQWRSKQEKMEKFFAPNVQVTVRSPEEEMIELELKTI